jgi:hypothetical protein
VALARSYDNVLGNILFSAKSLMQSNEDVVHHLKRRYYRFPALTPEQNAPATEVPNPPQLRVMAHRGDSIVISLSSTAQFKQALLYRSGKKNKTRYPIQKLIVKIPIDPANHTLAIPKYLMDKKYMALVFLDNFGRETEPIMIRNKQIPSDDQKR